MSILDFPGPQQEHEYITHSEAVPRPRVIKDWAAVTGGMSPLQAYANQQQPFITNSYTDVFIRNRTMLDVSKRITKINVSLSAQEQSQLTVEMEDPDFKVLHSRIFHGQPAMDFQGLRLELAGVATVNQGRGALRLAARSQGIQALKRRRGPLTVLGDERAFMNYECYKVGLPFVTVTDPVVVVDDLPGMRVSRDWQPYTQVHEIVSADEIPSSWTTFKRVAQQRGWMLFEANNVLYYAPPSWLFTNSTIVRVRWAGTPKQLKAKPQARDRHAYGVVIDSNGGQYWKSLVASGNYDPGVIDLLEVPEFDHSADRVETTVTFKVAAGNEAHFIPGKVVDVLGVPAFRGLYLIQTVNYDLTGSDITVTAQTPVDPQPQQGSTLGGFSRAGSRDAERTGGADLAGSGSDDLGLPVCGITISRFLKGLRTVESGGRYKSPPSYPGGASGAYQYIESTWQGVAPDAAVQRYPQAYLAPADMQDQVAENEVQAALRTYGDDWGKVAAHHFYPATAGRPHLWKYRPFMEPGGNPPSGYNPQSNPTVIDYVRRVLRASGGVACADFTGKSTKLASDFVHAAVSQIGKPYHQTVQIDYQHNGNPSVFDCSSLVQWACAQVGIMDMPRNSGDQWIHCRGRSMRVSDALKIRGALLWIDGEGRAGGQHVAISMGNGTDMAAHSPQLGLSILPTTASAWSRAATIPGMVYPNPGQRRIDF